MTRANERIHNILNRSIWQSSRSGLIRKFGLESQITWRSSLSRTALVVIVLFCWVARCWSRFHLPWRCSALLSSFIMPLANINASASCACIKFGPYRLQFAGVIPERLILLDPKVTTIGLKACVAISLQSLLWIVAFCSHGIGRFLSCTKQSLCALALGDCPLLVSVYLLTCWQVLVELIHCAQKNVAVNCLQQLCKYWPISIFFALN